MPRTKFESDEDRKSYYCERAARVRAKNKVLGIPQKQYISEESKAKIKAKRLIEKDTPEFKAKQKAADERHRAKLRAQGLSPWKPYTEEQKAAKREYARQRREEAKKQGIKLPGDNWAVENYERHRENGRKWKKSNPERNKELMRESQKKRRKTKWGQINNRFYGVLQIELRNCSPWHSRNSKYLEPLGYSFYDLYAHIASQFKEGMSWDNWGVWEIDHIKPLKLFRYESLDDPLFREAWALENLQPLWKDENRRKSAKY